MKVVNCLCTTVLAFALSASSAPVDEDNVDFELIRRTLTSFTGTEGTVIILPTGSLFPGSGHAQPSGTIPTINITLPVGGATPTVTQPITESLSPGISNLTSVPTLNVTVTPSVTPSVTISPSPTAILGNNGTAACNSVPDGSLVCKGEEQYGLCNRGRAIFQNVAPGTACITGADGTGKIGRASNSAACSAVADGSLVCNGPDQYGLCNQGSVTFTNVASGTQCYTEADGTRTIRSASNILSKG
ncbi:hypothetical protein KC351_g5345 [Hortaea werneckii]|nr:hypothetical protein KC351_g5345 [Hortaea werneckii]